MMLNCKFGVVTAAATITFAGIAEIVEFPSAGGDIASALDWGRETLPGIYDPAKFTATQTVTAGNDVEFGGLYIAGESKTVTFDMRDSVSGGSPRKIKMNGNACVYNGSNGNIWFAIYILRGGFWDFGSYSVGINSKDRFDGPTGCSLTIDGGAVLVCGQLLGAATQAGRTANIRVDGEGTVVTSGSFRVSNYNGYQNTATVANGAKIVLTGTGEDVLAIDYGNGGGNSLIVTNGAGVIKQSGNKKITIGRQGSDNRMAVESGSSVQIHGSVYFGHADSSNANASMGNRIVVRGTDSSMSVTEGTMYHGNANGVVALAGNSNNVVSVLNGGTVSCGRWHFYGHDNGIVISNATMSLSGGIKCETSQNCYLRLQGAHPSFASTASASDLFQFKDGFKFYYDIPVDGYDGTVEWPFVASGVASLDDSVAVEVSGAEGALARMKAEGVYKKTIRLARFAAGFEGGGGISDAMLANWNVALPDGATLCLDETDLILELKIKKGFVISFR